MLDALREFYFLSDSRFAFNRACFKGSAMPSNRLPQDMRIAVVGSGAVGCYYGGRLANDGRDVHFLMRSDLAHVTTHGLRVHSPAGDFFLPSVRAYGTPEEIGPCDLVIIALKATANDALGRLIPPLLHARTLLLTLQNGLGGDEWLAKRFGTERVLGGLCFVCLNRTAPGEVHHLAQGEISIGELSGPPQSRTQLIAAAFNQADVPCQVVESLATARWKKLAWNIPFNGLAIAAGGIDTQRILTDPGLNKLARELIREVIAAANRLGHELPPSIEDIQMKATESMGPYRPSSLIDFLEGRDVEVEPIWGEPLRRAQAAGAITPRLEMLYYLLRSQMEARGRS
jgi:2-dehydropantoate 2-reductase